MKRKNLKSKLGHGRCKRLREDEISAEIDENQNAKKSRADEANDQLKLFEERFKETIKTGIDLFHNRISLSAISFKERLAYMIILRKIMTSIEWKLKRLISNRQQMECLTRKAIESSKERRDMLNIMEKFVEYKLRSFPGKTVHFKAESVAKHYQCELKCYGVTQDILSSKINDLVKRIEETEGPLPKIEKHPKQIIKIINVKRNICRLCGSKQNLIYSINQKKEDIRFKDVVEYFCRVSVNENDNLPHLVCKVCKDYILNFSKFSERVKKFQNKLNLDADSYALPEEPIKTEIVDLDYESDSNSCNRDTDECNYESSQDYPEITTSEIEVGANYIYQDDNLITNSQNMCVTGDEILEIEPETIQNTNGNAEVQNNEEVEDNSYNEISCSEISTSTPTKSLPSKSSSSLTKECKIILEQLPIKFVPSDGEESQEELEEEINNSKKRKSNTPRQKSMSSLKTNTPQVQSSIPDLINPRS